jgi:outer membrane lipoprotein SlyB
MVTFILTLVVGVVGGVAATLRDRRPLRVTVLIGLVGAYAGALIGLLAGETIQGIAPALPWEAAGTSVGAIAGAIVALALDHQLQQSFRRSQSAASNETEQSEVHTFSLSPPGPPR